MAFANLEQATAEDQSAVTHPTMANITLAEQVALYANRLSTKEDDNMALRTDIKNLQGEVKNLKAEVASLKNSGHSGSAGAVNKENGRMNPRQKQEGQAHHPTWWITTYWWSHGVGVHSGLEYKNESLGHKIEATAITRLVGSMFDLPQGLWRLGSPTSNLYGTNNELNVENLGNLQN